MKDFDPAKSFGRGVAAAYDSQPRGDEDETVAFLREIAGDGRALELAIGTGRIARPLAAAGVRVEGVDISQAMVDVMRTHPHGAEIPVTMGNYRDVPAEGRFALIYIVFNTIHNLLTQDDQVACFVNVAKHLEEVGVFVVEAGPFSNMHMSGDEYVHVEALEVGMVGLDVARYDPVTQLLEESHVALSPSGVRLWPIVTRHIWPSEMDLMARIAGLHLHARYGAWDRRPYDRHSTNIISVYGR